MCEKANCQQCGQQMNKFQSVFKNQKEYFKKDLRKYCSESCASLAKRQRITQSCLYCKSDFLKLKCKDNLFCSKQCFYNYRKLNNINKIKTTPTPQYYKYKIKKKDIQYINCNWCQKTYIKTNTSVYCCKDCQKLGTHKTWSDARKLRGTNRKIELIKLSGGGCKHCGYSKCHRALTFHHIDPKTKTFTLDQSNLYKKNWDRIHSEFLKCELLCQNCHAIHHQKERQLLAPTQKKTKYTKIKNKLLDTFNWTCQRCKTKFEFNQALTFHHVDKSKKIFELNARGFLDKSKASIDAEIKKCQCLCFNCHMETEDELND